MFVAEEAFVVSQIHELSGLGPRFEPDELGCILNCPLRFKGRELSVADR
jgi:hypothetical protein